MGAENKYNPTSDNIEELIDVTEKLYQIWFADIKRKLDNISRIQLASFMELIEYNIENGDIKTDKDVISYIEQIIQD